MTEMHYKPQLMTHDKHPRLCEYTTERILRRLAHLVADTERRARDARPVIPREGTPEADEVARYARLLRDAEAYYFAFTSALETTSAEGRYDRGVPDTFARFLLKKARQTCGVIAKEGETK